MMTWIISGWFHFLFGFAVGWILFKRPQWVTYLINRAKAKVGL